MKPVIEYQEVEVIILTAKIETETYISPSERDRCSWSDEIPNTKEVYPAGTLTKKGSKLSIANGSGAIKGKTSQHVYFVSDETIAPGELCISIKANTLFTPDEYDIMSLVNKACKKVVASTDSLDTKEPRNGVIYSVITPKIPMSFVKDFAKADGKIDKVKVKSDNVYVEPVGIHSNRGYFKDAIQLTDDNEVIIILEAPEAEYTRKQVVALISKHSDYVDESIDYEGITSSPTAISIPEWDDKEFIKENL